MLVRRQSPAIISPQPAGELHLDALALVRRLHLLTLCRLAIHLAHQSPISALPAGRGGVSRVYSEESLLLLALLRARWRLSYQEAYDWLAAWPALALAYSLPLGSDGRVRVPSKAQHSKRLRAAGASSSELLFVLLVRAGLWVGLTRGRDLILDSAPSWPGARAGPDAAVGHAPAHHPRPLLRGYRLHTLLCRGTGLPLLFLVSPVNVHDAPFARSLLDLAIRLLAFPTIPAFQTTSEIAGLRAFILSYAVPPVVTALVILARDSFERLSHSPTGVAGDEADGLEFKPLR